MEIKTIIYVVLWGLIAVYCYFSAHKISPVLYLVGVFFTFLFGWYLTDGLIATDLFSGIFNIIFRCVAGIFLLILVIIYARSRTKNQK